MKKIRVAIWGFGAMGSGVARMILNKKGIEIAAVIDSWQELVGKDIFARLNLPRGGHEAVIITDKPEEVLYPGSCDLVILATDSFTAKAWPKIEFCVERGLSVISTAEEMSWPWAQSDQISQEMDRLARKHGAVVLGTGVNPGFVLDLLILTLSGSCEDVKRIEAARINDLSPFGRAVMEEQGVGMELTHFHQLNDSGQLAGHVGFPESISIIAAGLGVEIKRIEQTKEAIISELERKPPHAHVLPGQVAGIRQQSWGYRDDGEAFIHLDHPQQVLPQLAGVDTGDYITIDTGDYDLKMQIKPETPGGVGTIAMVVNMIPLVLNARPGLRNLLEMPIPRAILGDMRLLLDINKNEKRFYKTNDLVVVERIALAAGERSDAVPEETAATDLKLWLKGFLQADAYSGDLVQIETLSGRLTEGRLVNLNPAYHHDYGEMVPELIELRKRIRAIMREEA